MAKPKDHTSWIDQFESFEKSLNGQADSPFHRLRRSAIETFDHLGYPTSDDEAWKTTNLTPVTEVAFRPTREEDNASVARQDLEPYLFPGLEALRLVFINGVFSPSFSNLVELPAGIRLGALSDAMDSRDECVTRHLARHARMSDLTFTALNTAFVRDGAFVQIPRGTVLERPIHIVHYSAPGRAPSVSHPRNLFLLGENAQATILETYAGAPESVYFTNAVTEIVLEKTALLDHYKLELESGGAVHISNQHMVLGVASVATSHAFSIGGLFVRNDVNALLAGERCEPTINGFYLISDDQNVDNYTLLEHAEPGCPSHELYKGVLGGSARALFRGKIHVHQKAQQTDAYQSNQNLLLSEDARVNTKPQLEIYADDVKCSHGATVGQPDEQALFYLMARGIGPEKARQILLEAFAGELLERVKLKPVRDRLDGLIRAKLSDIQRSVS